MFIVVKKKGAVLFQQVPECILLNRFILRLGAFPLASAISNISPQLRVAERVNQPEEWFPHLELQHA